LNHLGGIAQLVERLPCTQEVSGSNPLTSTKETREEKPLDEIAKNRLAIKSLFINVLIILIKN